MGRFRDLLSIGGGGGTLDSTTDGAARRETVSRSSGVLGNVSGAERIEAERVPVPANEIRKYWRMYKTVPFVRASFNQFRDDVMAVGYRPEADSDSAQTYLRNWAKTAGVIGAERGRDLFAILNEIPVQLLARGTVLLEHTPDESEGDRTAGVSFIHPATVTPYRASDTGLLLRPDDTQYEGAKLTADGKAAAYVQFDGTDDERRLTLDDVTRITHDADTDDVFGTSAVAPAAPRIEAVREKLQDNDRAVESMGWGQWFVGFGHEKVKNDDGSETVIEWEDDDMDKFVDDLESVEPGDIEGHDGTINIQNLPGEVADIFDQLRFETHYILTSMPAPTYAVGFESDINQFVVDGQEARHEQRVSAFRSKIDRRLRPLARTVLNEANRQSSGARILLETPEEDSPVLNMSDAEIDKVARYASAFKEVSGGKPRTLLPDEVIRREVLQMEDVDENGGWEPDELDNMSESDLAEALEGAGIETTAEGEEADGER